jgi:hypothetical protein
MLPKFIFKINVIPGFQLKLVVLFINIIEGNDVY